MPRPFHHHEFLFDNETAEHVVFRCEHCKRSIGFHKPPSLTQPQAVKDKDEWIIPPEHHAQGGAIDVTIGKCDA